MLWRAADFFSAHVKRTSDPSASSKLTHFSSLQLQLISQQVRSKTATPTRCSACLSSNVLAPSTYHDAQTTPQSHRQISIPCRPVLFITLARGYRSKSSLVSIVETSLCFANPDQLYPALMVNSANVVYQSAVLITLDQRLSTWYPPGEMSRTSSPTFEDHGHWRLATWNR